MSSVLKTNYLFLFLFEFLTRLQLCSSSIHFYTAYHVCKHVPMTETIIINPDHSIKDVSEIKSMSYLR